MIDHDQSLGPLNSPSMSRRGLLLSAGVGSAAVMLGPNVEARSRPALRANSFFLSARNPVATSDQRRIEDVTLRILDRPDVRRARDNIALLWRSGVAKQYLGDPARLETAINEFFFNYALRAANSDPSHPKIVRFMAPAHRWFGREVPGSRWAGDSPDFIYRLLPVEHGGRYEIHGQATCSEPPTVNYQLLATRAAPVPVDILSSLDMVTDSNGAFTITIDERPADGRKNHIQTRPGVDHIMVRDALGDWLRQTPNALRVVRLNPPQRGPLDEDEIAQRAVQNARDAIYYTYYMTQSAQSLALNTIRPPMSSDTFGGMPTQWGVKGALDLGPDDALVVRANAAGALFRNVVLCDAFFLTTDYWSRTGSLNMRQMAADADGSFTYVVAHHDPGLHNWLDTGGVRHLLFGQRWQAIPQGYAGEKPRMTVELAKFAELGRAVPGGARPIDAAGRRDQLAKRAVGFAKRFIDS